MSTDPANWLRLAIHNWLSGNGSLSALGLSSDDRLAARRWLRNRRIKAAWQLIPGDKFSSRLAALVAAVERVDRVNHGYKHQRVVAPIFIELEMAAHWGKLPDERQLRSIVSENNEAFPFQETSNNIILKILNEDEFNDALPAEFNQRASQSRLRQVAGAAK